MLISPHFMAMRAKKKKHTAVFTICFFTSYIRFCQGHQFFHQREVNALPSRST